MSLGLSLGLTLKHQSFFLYIYVHGKSQTPTEDFYRPGVFCFRWKLAWASPGPEHSALCPTGAQVLINGIKQFEMLRTVRLRVRNKRNAVCPDSRKGPSTLTGSDVDRDSGLTSQKRLRGCIRFGGVSREPCRRQTEFKLNRGKRKGPSEDKVIGVWGGGQMWTGGGGRTGSGSLLTRRQASCRALKDPPQQPILIQFRMYEVEVYCAQASAKSCWGQRS